MLLFEPEKKNRRLTPWEEQEDKQESRIWKRARKTFLYDIPYYYDCNPEPLVNFHLGFKDK